MQQASRWIRALAFAPLAICLGCAAPAIKPGTTAMGANQPSAFSKMGESIASWPVSKAVSAPFKSGGKSATPEVSASDPVALQNKPALHGADYQVSVAVMQETSGSDDGAIAAYEKALEIDPKHLPALMGLAHLYDRKAKYDKAISLYQRAIAAYPKSSTTHNDLGICYCRKGMYEESLSELKRAINLSPERQLYRNNIATLLVELNRIDEAYDQLKEVHGEAVAHYNLGCLLVNKKRNADASEQFSLALAHRPDLKEAQIWIAKLNAAPADRSPNKIASPQVASNRADPNASPADFQPSVKQSSPSRQVAVVRQAVPSPDTPINIWALRSDQPDPRDVIPLPAVHGEAEYGVVKPMEEPLVELAGIESTRRVPAQTVTYPKASIPQPLSEDRFEAAPEPQRAIAPPRNEIRLLPPTDE